ncbi:hypothetical protein M959_09651, partial [Chaetura pelagica]
RTLSSLTSEEPTAHQELGAITSEHRPSATSFPRGLPGLSQPLPSRGFFPYCRTEGELCTDPAPGDRFFSRTEGLENQEGSQGEETGLWSLYSRCLI